MSCPNLGVGPSNRVIEKWGPRDQVVVGIIDSDADADQMC